MVWIALGLMGMAVALVGLQTYRGKWGMHDWRMPRRGGPTFPDIIDSYHLRASVSPLPMGARAGEMAVFGTVGALVSPNVRTEQGHLLAWSGFQVFSSGVIFSLFLSFLLPVWSLAFATEAMGGERESGTLIWLLTRPLSRPAIYLGKFVAVLPWSVGFNLVGFAALCLAAGPPGWRALGLFWPAVAGASLAFSALFFLLGATARWPAVLGMVYSFCLEVVVSNMPGYLKRISISFYTRCLMFEAAESYGLQPENPWVFLPVDAWTAWAVLLGGTAALVIIGMVIFSQLQSREQV
jgi:ABC-type Na+ efflux pump permease subunit